LVFVLNKAMKRDHPVLVFAAFIAVLVASLHIAASAFYWYWTMPWLDIPFHFLGGIFTSLLVFWFLRIKHVPRFLSNKQSGSGFFFLVIGVTMLISAGWEALENLAGVVNETDYIFDTSIDLAMDLLGALSAYYFAFSRFKDTILANVLGAEK